MKIGFDAKRAFLNKSGLGNYSRDLIKSLYDFYPENQYFLFTPKANTDLLNTDFQKNVISPQGLDKCFPSFWRSLKLGKEISKYNIDIYHGLSNELPKNINKANTFKIVTIHDLIFIKYPQLYKAFDRYIYKLKFKNSCINADKIIAISNQTKKDIIENFNISENKITVIYQGCNPKFYNNPEPEDIENVKRKYSLPETFILTVGTIEQRKNALNVLKAIYFFNIDVYYVLIGRKTSYLKKILDYAKEHGLTKRIIILENVNNRDLRTIYRLSKIFIYPSIYEGFGIPILEAQNSQVPVITSDCGSTVEAAGGAAELVNPHDPKSIGKAIKKLLENSYLRTSLIQKGLNNAQNFRQDIIANNLINLYKSIK